MWMQADEAETKLVSVESADKFDHSTLAVECSVEEFRTIEASLYQVLHRTTANEPLRKNDNKHEGRRASKEWHAIVRRYDQRNISKKQSAYVALISNNSERG